MSYKMKLYAFRPGRELFNAACLSALPWRIRERNYKRAVFAIGDGRETFRGVA